MVKCEICGYKNDKVKLPMICPQCGGIAKPYVVKERKSKKKDETVVIKEEVTLQKLEENTGE